MKPSETARAVTRIAHWINSSAQPSVRAVTQDLKQLRWALLGNKSAQRFIRGRLLQAAGQMDVLRDIDITFNNAGVYPPVMKDVGGGVFKGNIADNIDLEVRIDGDKLSDIKVNGKPCKDLTEAIETYQFMKKNPTLDQPEAGASSDGDPGSVKCDVCGKTFSTETEPGSWGQCPHCKAEHTQCPGCDGWYEMTKNTDDHCPLCGYSSWGDDDSDEDQQQQQQEPQD